MGSDPEKERRRRKTPPGVTAGQTTLFDPDDERELDRLLEQSVPGAEEPALLIFERLLSRFRIRREV